MFQESRTRKSMKTRTPKNPKTLEHKEEKIDYQKERATKEVMRIKKTTTQNRGKTERLRSLY